MLVTWASQQQVIDSAATALFDRMTTQPNGLHKQAINARIIAYKAAGVWERLDALYGLAAADAQAASLNWISAAINLTAVNSPTFTPDRGFTGDGATSYLDTGTLWNGGLSKFSLNDSMMFSYELTEVSNGSFSVGASLTSSRNRLLPRNVGNALARNSAMSSLVAVLPVATSIGLIASQRTGSISEEMFKNGVSIGTGVVASTSLSLGNIVLLLDNSTFSARQLATVGIGRSLSPAQHAAIYAADLAYLQALGAQ